MLYRLHVLYDPNCQTVNHRSAIDTHRYNDIIVTNYLGLLMDPSCALIVIVVYALLPRDNVR